MYDKVITIFTKPVPVNQKYGVINGKLLLTKKYRSCKSDIANELHYATLKQELITDPVVLKVVQYFGDNRKRDCDAYLKVLLDAMEDVIIKDDNQIQELHVYKHVDKENPRIELELKKLVWEHLH